MPAWDSMEFGGHTAYDGNGYAEAFACTGGIIDRGGGVGYFPIVGWMQRFARLFASVASLTPFCTLYTKNIPVE
ncbi:MAG TPA: hypothetical protein VG815_16840 [Chloroflexota bacterium]|nr:hypothetical protein [Chloroflexota bacterium]